MKYFLVASLVILSVNVSNAQTKLGIKINPAIITQRVSSNQDSIDIVKGPNAFNLSAVLFADLSMSQNYFFTLGLGYTSKRINLKMIKEDATQNKSYNIQYVQIPAILKLYTNEIALDKKLHFQFGPLIEVAVYNKETNRQTQIIDKFQPLDVSLFFATGLEIQLAPQTALQVGISYTRGLINVVKDPADGIGDFIIKNDLYGLDIALKF